MTNKTKTSILNRILSWIFGGNKNEEPIYVKRREEVINKDHILYEMNIIDSKSSALLTHVSIMLAVVVVLITGTNGLWKIILTVELLAFSLVGMLLLRCVDIMGPPYRMPPENADDATSIYNREIRLRRGIYQAMVRTVFILTFLLVIIMIIKTILIN